MNFSFSGQIKLAKLYFETVIIFYKISKKESKKAISNTIKLLNE